jgi:hypothetical protein
MYAIKAEFDGTNIMPKEPVPVDGPYEVIVTFTRPKTWPRQKERVSFESGLDFAGIFDRDDVAIIESLKADGKRRAEKRFAEMENTGVDPLKKYCGALKDVFTEDGVDYQRRIRDEWPD